MKLSIQIMLFIMLSPNAFALDVSSGTGYGLTVMHQTAELEVSNDLGVDKKQRMA